MWDSNLAHLIILSILKKGIAHIINYDISKLYVKL